MNTDIQVEEIKKQERRKTFKAMNALPWALLVIVLVILLASNKRHTLNDVTPAPATPKEFVEPVVSNKQQIVIITNIINKTVVTTVVVTNIVQTINNDEFVKRWNVLESNLYKRAQQDIRVEAVSNGYARWSCTVEGVPVFEWRNELLSATNTVKGPKIEPRELPFTYRNMSLAKNLDIEKELRTSIYQVIDMDFVELAEISDANAVKEKLQEDIDRVIKELFDGFETYNKTGKHW